MDTQQIDALIRLRDDARRAGDYLLADRIREDLFDRGYDVHDGPDGTTWVKSPTRLTPDEQAKRDAFWARIKERQHG